MGFIVNWHPVGDTMSNIIALDLIQSTIVDLIKNEEKLMDSDQPMAYAKRI